MAKKTYTQSLFFDPDLKTPEHDALMLHLDHHIADLITAASVVEHGFSVVLDKRWEHPVRSQRGKYSAVIGFVDMLVVVGKPYPAIERVDARMLDDYEVREFERAGYIDTDDGLLIKDVVRYSKKEIYIEVKSKIESICELIRQARFYQASLPDHAVFAVASPDDRFADILQQQGIGFIRLRHADVGPHGSLL